MQPFSRSLSLWHLAWRGVRVRRIRSLLTALSVGVAAASLTTFLSLGAGLRRAVTEQIGSIGPQLQLSGADLLQSFSPPAVLPERLTTQVEALRTRLELSSVTPVLLGSQGEGTARTTLYGVPAALGLKAIFPAVRIGSGRDLLPGDEGQAVAVLGAALAGRTRLSAGHQIRVGRTRLRVIGVLAPTATLTDGFLVVPLHTLQRVLRVPHLISLVAVQVADERKVPRVAAELARLTGSEVQTQAEFRAVTRRLLAVSDSLGGVLALVALLVGTLGVLNTVSMSVLERRSEFAALRALGARPAWVLRLVVAESLLLSLLGGILGLGLGGLASLLISEVTSASFGIRAALLTVPAAGVVILTCLLIGLLSGLPAGWRGGRTLITAGLEAH
ncbi:ABC transporter permease [Deinococcus sp.]|uniref:ABC transporter permease n=1 Tax=Deinococcus sp. TaxID=47478 RepID=UPI003CC5F24D